VTNRSRILWACAALALGAQTPAFAWPGSNCKYTAQRVATLPVNGAKRIVIRVGPGDLVVRGVKSGAAVTAHGKACAPTEDQLAKTAIDISRDGDSVLIATAIPTAKSRPGTLWGTAEPYIDVEIDLPAEIPISLDDGPGDARVINIAGGTIRDTSGDLTIDGVSGDLDVVDSSGDININGVGGKLSMDDSSGDINIRNVKGAVLIRNDSSGDINVTNAGADVTIANDSSGDVDINGVGGSFTLGNKGSGEVSVHGVQGQVKIPDYKQ